MKELLYKAIRNYCDENRCWKTKNTAREWNELLSTNYSGATFTALVNSGLLERAKLYKETAYRYYLPPSPEEVAKREEAEKQIEIDTARFNITNYEKVLARIEEDYLKELAKAEENRRSRLEWENERYKKAKELLDSIE